MPALFLERVETKRARVALKLLDVGRHVFEDLQCSVLGWVELVVEVLNAVWFFSDQFCPLFIVLQSPCDNKVLDCALQMFLHSLLAVLIDILDGMLERLQVLLLVVLFTLGFLQ